jgi:hypothetical protein
MTSTPASDPGLAGYIVSLSSTGSPPRSLRLLEAALNKQGFTTGMWQAVPATLPLHQADLFMNTGWLLTWWRSDKKSLAECGSVWVAGGVEGFEIPFISTRAPRSGDEP